MKNKPQPPDAVFHSVSALLPHRIRVYALHPGIVKMRIRRLPPSVHRFRPETAEASAKVHLCSLWFHPSSAGSFSSKW